MLSLPRFWLENLLPSTWRSGKPLNVVKPLIAYQVLWRLVWTQIKTTPADGTITRAAFAVEDKLVTMAACVPIMN
jgi:hypothetical protein